MTAKPERSAVWRNNVCPHVSHEIEHAPPPIPTQSEHAGSIAPGLREQVEALHARVGPAMVAMLARRTGSPLVAEDLAQRTWAALWKTIADGRYDPARASLGTLSYAIAINIWRAHARARPGPTSTDELDHALGRDTDPAAAVTQAELIERVRSALRGDGARGGPALSADDLHVLRLIAGGASDRDIAARLGVAASTANARKRATLDALRRLITAERPGPGAQSTGGATP